MKINKAKLLVGTLAMISVAATAGSISGTVAWWQNSYRASAEFQGTSANAGELLEIETVNASGNHEGWVNALTPANITNLIKKKSNNKKADQILRPVTLPGVAKDVALGTLYRAPSYQQSAGAYTNWKEAKAEDYVQFDLTFRVKNEANQGGLSADAFNLYLSDLTIENKTTDGKNDISRGVRVHIAGTSDYALLAKGANSSDADVTTVTNGKLDIGGRAGKLDRDGKAYSFSTSHGDLINYGTENSQQVAYNSLKANSGVYPTSFAGGQANGGVAFGTIAAGQTLTITVTIFLEGWQAFATGAGASERVVATFADEAARDLAINGSVDPVVAPTYTPEIGDIIRIGNAQDGYAYSVYTQGTTPSWVAYDAFSMWDEVKTAGSIFDLGMTFDAAAPNV